MTDFYKPYCVIANKLAGKFTLVKIQNTMRNFCFLLLLALLFTNNLFAQMPPSKTAEVAAKLALLPIKEGEWTGIGVQQFGPNRFEVDQYEKITPMLDGSVLLIEGMGKHQGTVRHHALATLSYNPATQKYVMRSFKDGYMVDAETELKEDGSFVWTMQNGPATSRFTVRLMNGTWLETGEYSMDGGKTWTPMLEMKLQKKQ